MKRHVALDKRQTFTVILRPEPEGGFTVRVPALPEIVTFGSDEAQALVMAEDAIRLVLEDRTTNGEPLPDNNHKMQIREVTVTVSA